MRGARLFPLLGLCAMVGCSSSRPSPMQQRQQDPTGSTTSIQQAPTTSPNREAPSAIPRLADSAARDLITTWSREARPDTPHRLAVLPAINDDGAVSRFGQDWSTHLAAAISNQGSHYVGVSLRELHPEDEDAVFRAAWGERKCRYRIYSRVMGGGRLSVELRNWDDQVLATTLLSIPASEALDLPATVSKPTRRLTEEEARTRQAMIRSMDRLVGAKPPLTAKVLFFPDKGPPIYTTGETVKLDVKSTVGGYLNVVHIGSDGEPALLLPNDSQRQVWVDKDQTTTIFPIEIVDVQDDGVHRTTRRRLVNVTVSEPYGTELLLGIVTERPIEWRSLIRRHEPGTRLYKLDDLETFDSVLAELRTMQWASGTVTIETKQR